MEQILIASTSSQDYFTLNDGALHQKITLTMYKKYFKKDLNVVILSVVAAADN